MNAKLMVIAETCLVGAHDDTLPFPQVIGRLAEAGFDGYHVDFRANCQTYYIPDGDNVTFQLPGRPGLVAAPFDADGVAEQVCLAQAAGPDYTYDGFCENILKEGCAGYIVSIAGKRVVYYGRTAETHIERFPE